LDKGTQGSLDKTLGRGVLLMSVAFDIWGSADPREWQFLEIIKGPVLHMQTDQPRAHTPLPLPWDSHTVAAIHLL
jgi:hypothetical protein